MFDVSSQSTRVKYVRREGGDSNSGYAFLEKLTIQ